MLRSPRALIIAECASNHGGDPQAIQDLIDAAADNGADVVKFQAYRAALLWPDDPQYTWLKQAELHDAAITTILAMAPGVPKMFSVFDSQRTDQLRRLGVTWFKVGHGDSHRLALIDPQEGEHWFVSLPWGRGNPHRSVTALATIPVYPAPLEACAALPDFTRLGCQGYSDHTIGLNAVKIMLARGATAVEKHFSLPTSPRQQPWDMTVEQLHELREWAHVCAVAKGGTPHYDRWEHGSHRGSIGSS